MNGQEDAVVPTKGRMPASLSLPVMLDTHFSNPSCFTARRSTATKHKNTYLRTQLDYALLVWVGNLKYVSTARTHTSVDSRKNPVAIEKITRT
jgi:hypothetical protein